MKQQARPSIAYICGTSAVFDFDEAQAACYLAALIDGEGCVYYPKSGKSKKRSIQVTNTDWDIIEAMIDCCHILDIHFSIHAVPRKPPWTSGWSVMISGRTNLLKCAQLLPMRARRKREALDIALATYENRRGGTTGMKRHSDEQREARVIAFRELEMRRRGANAAALLDAHVRSGLSETKEADKSDAR